ncbi:MAG: methyltransferase domain-containing protein [Oscillospiraceae bacterium]
MQNFFCPICKTSFTKNVNSLICEHNHCFDIHKSGYVNLLLSNKMNSKTPGDNKIMVETRNHFLSKDYYLPLKNALCDAVLKLALKINNRPITLLDAGCGEGYYTNAVYNALTNKNFKDNQINLFGVDISKVALNFAGKRLQNTSCKLAVASVFDIPLPNNSCDILFTLFAPYCGEEFLRVLKKDSYMLMVIPDKKHLFELKKIVYENPYENEVKSEELSGFQFIESKKISEKICLSSNEDIMNLFMMTPYYYKTSKIDTQKLLKYNKLETTIEFSILVYKKI